MLQSSLDEIKEDAMDSVVDDDTLSKYGYPRAGANGSSLPQGSEQLNNVEAGAAQQSNGDGPLQFASREAIASTHSTTITKKIGTISAGVRG